MKKNYLQFIIPIVIVVAVITFLFLVKPKKTLEKHTKIIYYMNTVIDLTIYHEFEETAEKHFQEIETIYKEYHELTDYFNAYKDIKNINYLNNKKAGQDKIDQRLYDLLEISVDYYQETNGLLNINTGDLTNIWKNAIFDKKLPSKEILEDIVISEPSIHFLENNTISYEKLTLDLGAIAKGHATEIAANYLKSNNIKHYIINAGGNVVVGTHPEKDVFTVGIEDPRDSSKNKKIIKIKNKSIVTSGGYERFSVIDNKKYHHIIDPFTRYPSDKLEAVTIISDSSTEADALSTSLFLMTYEEGKRFIDGKNIEVLWQNKNETYQTKGFKQYE